MLIVGKDSKRDKSKKDKHKKKKKGSDEEDSDREILPRYEVEQTWSTWSFIFCISTFSTTNVDELTELHAKLSAYYNKLTVKDSKKKKKRKRHSSDSTDSSSSSSGRFVYRQCSLKKDY